MSNKRKRSLVIEAYKHRVTIDPEYGDKAWNILEHAIHQIYNQNACDLSFEDLYRHSYNMILNKFGAKLYSGLVATMTSHLKEMARSVEATQGSSFLEELNSKWNDHNEELQMIRDILMYADRTYIPETKKTHVYELGLNLWRENVIYSNQIRTRLSNTLLELVCKYCAGEDVNGELIRNITKMLMDLVPSVYEQEFETPLLHVIAEFYRAKYRKFIECCDSVDSLKKAERHLNEEMDRLSHCLDIRTKKKITNILDKEIIEKHMLRLICMENSWLVNMLCGDEYDDLCRMYNLFHLVPDGLSKIREVMTSHSRESTKQLVTDQERLKDPVEFVQRLLDEKDKYDKIINLEFSNNKLFQNALNSSFEFFINLNPRSAEYISLFVDDKLRKGLKEVTNDDVEIALEKVMMLFRYLQEKDLFEKYYKQHLAKRLLAGKSVSEDAERSLIIKLEKECGYQFTSKLEGMFTDMKTSLDTTKGFYSNHPELVDGPIILTVHVLTTGFWPTQSSVICNLPAEMSALCEKFRSYYLGSHTDRRLSWKTNMGTAVLEATFGQGQRHELNVSTYQMCVLVLFNNADRLSYKEIEEATKIPASDLKRCLQSLALVKGINVLKKEPMSKDVSEDDTFYVNDKFSSKLYKVKLENVVAQKESEPEKLKSWQRLKKDRGPQIEAAIVRIMKSRKQLDHNNLLAEVPKQLQSGFLANPTEVKKQIESLIEREYLERDDSDRKLYRYLP